MRNGELCASDTDGLSRAGMRSADVQGHLRNSALRGQVSDAEVTAGASCRGKRASDHLGSLSLE